MEQLEQTLDSREVAEMIEKAHCELLKDMRRYASQFNEGNLPYVEFFAESTYKDAKGEIRPCYRITKKGCEFIAHKLTGTKGTIFTARYINRFHEMEDEIKEKKYLPEESLSGIGKILEVMERIMVSQNADPSDIAKVTKSMLNQFGVRIPRTFAATRPRLPMGISGRKKDIIDLIDKIDDSVFLFRVYVSLRDFVKEKGVSA